MFTPGPATSLGSFWTAKTFSLSGSRLENSQPPVAQRLPRLKAIEKYVGFKRKLPESNAPGPCAAKRDLGSGL